MKAPTRYDALLAAVRALVDAERASKVACDRRGAMPPGSTRARVTTANANWARAAEHRDRCQEIVAREVMNAGILGIGFITALGWVPQSETLPLDLPDLSSTSDEHVRILMDHGINEEVRKHAENTLRARKVLR